MLAVGKYISSSPRFSHPRADPTPRPISACSRTTRSSMAARATAWRLPAMNQRHRPGTIYRCLPRSLATIRDARKQGIKLPAEIPKSLTNVRVQMSVTPPAPALSALSLVTARCLPAQSVTITDAILHTILRRGPISKNRESREVSCGTERTAVEAIT